MKKLLSMAIALSFLAVACGGSKPVETQPVQQSNACLQGAPDWVLSGGAEGGLSASGSATIGKAGVNHARTMALASARDELARIFSVKVNNMVKDFTQTTGVGDDETVDKVSATVSKQVASQTIQGSRQAGLWSSPCNELWVLVSVDPTNLEQIKASVKQAVNSSYKNENALYQQFLGKKAQEELDEEIKKMFQ